LGLIESADDRSPAVQQAVSDALLAIGRKHVDLVLSTALEFLISNLKVKRDVNLHDDTTRDKIHGNKKTHQWD